METFRALLTCMQFTNAHIMAITEEAPEDLKTFTHSDVKAFFKHLASHGIHVPYMSQQCFYILCFWVEKRTSIGIPILPQLLTDEQLTLWGERMKASADTTEAQRTTISAPGQYKKDMK
jgi:hypothetical protein